MNKIQFDSDYPYTVQPCIESHDVDVANARLIAAAAEMYEALKQTQAALTYFIDSVEEQVDQKIRGERKKFSFNGDLVQSFEEALSAQEMARAVIAKAKGETQ